MAGCPWALSRGSWGPPSSLRAAQGVVEQGGRVLRAPGRSCSVFHRLNSKATQHHLNCSFQPTRFEGRGLDPISRRDRCPSIQEGSRACGMGGNVTIFGKKKSPAPCFGSCYPRSPSDFSCIISFSPKEGWVIFCVPS